MAYTPTTWQCGETITAEKLNKMDNGWGISSTQLFSESVTTVNNEGMAWGGFAYSPQITADSISVTFDGIEYSVNKFVDTDDNNVYGELSGDAPTFNTYPFFIISTQYDGNMIATQNAGTYTVAVSAEGVEVSGTFSSAVGSCMVVPVFSETSVGSGVFTCDMTFDEVNKACAEGRCFQALINGINAPLSRHTVAQDSFAYITVSSTSVKRTEVAFFSDGSIQALTTSYPS